MRCPSCNGKRFITGFDGGRDECYLCRSLGVVTPEAHRLWQAEQEAERIRLIRADLARQAIEATQWEQLAFEWEEHWAKVKVEKAKKACCQTQERLPSTTDHRQISLAFEEPSEIISDGQQQHGAYADQYATV